MDNKHNSDISADELLAQLKANMAENGPQEGGDKADTRKKYKFRRSGKITASVSEEDIKAQMPDNSGYTYESPVPKSDIEDLDIDELMKRYLPEEDYRRMTEKAEAAEIEDDFVETLSSIDIPEEASELDESDAYDENAKDYTAPDEELYNHLSEGGKVCDVPELDVYNRMADTMQAPLRPMTDVEKTIAFGSDEEEGGFMSVREILAAQNEPFEPEAEETEEESAVSGDTIALDLSSTVEINLPEERTEVTSDTLTFNALEEVFISENENEPSEETEGGSDGEDFDTADEEVMPKHEAETLDEPETMAEFAHDEEPENGEDNDLSSLEGIFSDGSLSLDESVFDSVYIDGEKPVYDPDGEYSELLDAEEAEAETSFDEESPASPVEFDKYSEFADGLDENEFDETDANLMLAFGMDEELDAAIGKESADKLRSDADNYIPEGEPVKEKQKAEEVKEPIKEFVSPTEIKGIFDSYKAEYGKSAIKLIVLAAISLILFFYENIGIFGGKLPDVFDPEFYPIVHIMTGLQLLIIGFAVLYKEVICGFKSFIAKKPTAESLLPAMLAVSVIYSILACFFGAGKTILGFNFPMALSVMCFAIGKRLDLRREAMTFRVISSRRSKFALEKLDIIDAELETKAFDKFLPKQPDIFRINKTAFVDGYFRRTGEYSSVKQVLSAFVPATLLAFIIGLIIGAVTTKDFAGAVSTAYAAFAFALPAAVFFIFSLPMFRASKISYDDGSAIVGEGALDEYTSASSISFDDREVFPTAGVKLRSIKVFGSGRLDTAIYYMASIYSRIGGPLSDVLNVATADIGRSQDIEVLSIDSDGIETLVDGHHLYAGKADYLRHNGYLPVTDPDDEEIECGDISIMFLVCDDEVVAKFYVRYRIDPEFEATLKNLYKSGICVGIKTVDPNINDEMLSTRIRLTKYPVRVLKYDDLNDRSRGSDRTDSGVVSKKSVKALLRAFTLCDKTKHITKTNIMIAALSLLGGIVITAAVSFLGSISAIGSVYVALYQLFWLASVYLISRFLLM